VWCASHEVTFRRAQGFLLECGSVGVVLRDLLVGVLLLTLGTILFAVRGYLNTGDMAMAGALIFFSP
jgi:hypothetical protein